MYPFHHLNFYRPHTTPYIAQKMRKVTESSAMYTAQTKRLHEILCLHHTINLSRRQLAGDLIFTWWFSRVRFPPVCVSVRTATGPAKRHVHRFPWISCVPAPSGRRHSHYCSSGRFPFVCSGLYQADTKTIRPQCEVGMAAVGPGRHWSRVAFPRGRWGQPSSGLERWTAMNTTHDSSGQLQLPMSRCRSRAKFPQSVVLLMPLCGSRSILLPAR